MHTLTRRSETLHQPLIRLDEVLREVAVTIFKTINELIKLDLSTEKLEIIFVTVGAKKKTSRFVNVVVDETYCQLVKQASFPMPFAGLDETQVTLRAFNLMRVLHATRPPTSRRLVAMLRNHVAVMLQYSDVAAPVTLKIVLKQLAVSLQAHQQTLAFRTTTTLNKKSNTAKVPHAPSLPQETDSERL
jgi:hypothetical protein